MTLGQWPLLMILTSSRRTLEIGSHIFIKKENNQVIYPIWATGFPHQRSPGLAAAHLLWTRLLVGAAWRFIQPGFPFNLPIGGQLSRKPTTLSKDLTQRP